jgi:hypothetical protein
VRWRDVNLLAAAPQSLGAHHSLLQLRAELAQLLL